MNDFSLLNNRKIIDILIGDTKLFEQYGLPYMSGPDLCQLCTSFGLSKTYIWGGVNGSRWTYMQSLLEKYINEDTQIGTPFVVTMRELMEFFVNKQLGK